MGHIKKRSKGSWTLWYDLPRLADGARRQKTVTVRGTKKDAELELRRIEYELQTGTHTHPTKITIGEYFDQWLEHVEGAVSPKTFQGYQCIVVHHITPSLGAIRLSKLQPLDIEQYYHRLLRHGRVDGKGGLSAQTIKHHHALIHTALSQAVNWRLLPCNPAEAVSPPRVARREMNVLDEAQTAQLLEYASGTRLYVPILLAVTTGMRRGEVLGLRWTDVEFESATIAVRRSLQQVKDGLYFKEPKTGRGRVVHLPQVTAEALRRHRIGQAERQLLLGPDYADQGLTVARDDGTPWPPNLLSRNFCDFIERHPDLPRISFHALRHGFATLSLGRGIHPKIVSEGLGHSGVSITLDLYSHATPALGSEAASIFDSILNKNH